MLISMVVHISLTAAASLLLQLHPQIASQAGSKLSRMAQSFMRDLQVGQRSGVCAGGL